MTDLLLDQLDSAQPFSRASGTIAPPVAFTGAAVALGCALQINFGQSDPAALLLLGVAAAFALIGLRNLATVNSSTTLLLPALTAGLVVQFALLLGSNPMATLHVESARDLLPFRIGLILTGLCAFLAISSHRRRGLFLGLMLATHFLLGLWVLHAMPQPGIDVCLFQREACKAILHGHNPYAISYSNPYADAARVYGPGTFAGDRLLFGYPYPPLSLLLILPGHLLGDFRFGHLLATTVAGALIATSRPSRMATAAAALFLFTPRMFFVLEAGWTEPLAVLLLTATLFAACRGHGSTVIWIALLFAVKQYLILVLPLAVVLLLRRKELRPRGAVIAAIVLAACISLPLALWNIRAFVWSAGTLQFHQPLRSDALSYLPMLIRATGLAIPAGIAFVAAFCVIAWALRSCPRTAASFAGATAVTFLVFFALNKQAFCNYYFLVIGALCCAIAVSDGARAPRLDAAQSSKPEPNQVPLRS